MSILLMSFAKGFATSAALIMAIGAQNMFVLRQGLRREHVGPIVLMCAIADAVLIAAGVAGLGAILRLVPNLAIVLTLGGAGFLAWYGVSALGRGLKPTSMTVVEQPRLSLRAALAAAAGFTFLNPHVYLDTVLLMGTIGSAQPDFARPAFVLAAALASLIWFALLGYGARLLTPLFARPLAWRILDGFVGVAMLALAAGLLSRVPALSS